MELVLEYRTQSIVGMLFGIPGILLGLFVGVVFANENSIHR